MRRVPRDRAERMRPRNYIDERVLYLRPRAQRRDEPMTKENNRTRHLRYDAIEMRVREEMCIDCTARPKGQFES